MTEITAELVLKYDRPGPRYTSYPTAPEWRADFGADEYARALERAAQRPDDPLSLYVHIPFCQERCAFCGCNVVITKKEGVSDRYLDYLVREMDLVAERLDGRRRLSQLHWGGGTPTFLHPDQIERLFGEITARFTLESGAEVALETDPRVTSHEQVQLLRRLGFNRVSMGVQDLDPTVQCEIHRYQTEEQTVRLVEWLRAAGFEGINIDLVYGLPMQKVERWGETIEKIIAIQPHRLAVYSYAHLPQKLRNQKRIDASHLPTPNEKIELLVTARRRFCEAGYRAIGMDHFALPDDELTRAMDEGRLNRNFMGYTVTPASDMIGLGTSSIGEVGGAYAQNEKKLSTYYEALDAGHFATHCGCVLSEDDHIRAWVIRRLMCNFRLEFAELERRFGMQYDTYFETEEAALAPYYEEGFIIRKDWGLEIIDLGQVFVRNIAMCFDAYLRREGAAKQFSRTV